MLGSYTRWIIQSARREAEIKPQPGQVGYLIFPSHDKPGNIFCLFHGQLVLIGAPGGITPRFERLGHNDVMDTQVCANCGRRIREANDAQK